LILSIAQQEHRSSDFFLPPLTKGSLGVPWSRGSLECEF
jgi:hypothetical protein